MGNMSEYYLVIGRVIVNLVNTSGFDSMRIDPPFFLTLFLIMSIPIPLPEVISAFSVVVRPGKKIKSIIFFFDNLLA